MILGIELGSTRIKSVIIDNAGSVIATGAYSWENRLEKGFWTYSVEEIWHGLQESYADLKRKYESRFSKKLTQFDAIGISAMMHGYLAFDENDELLVPFRTWRNTNTGEAAEILSNELNFNMPLRWSASHLLQAVINREEHIHKICYITTLAGYVHYKLTGEKVLGIGDASGMFPIKNGEYDPDRIEKFESVLRKYGFEKSAKSLLPQILVAGEKAGSLTEKGARLLDVSGDLVSGIQLCPPEGDAGTGMVATNSIRFGTGNVSAGTSAFLMAVLDQELDRCYKEIDVVTTPHGAPVAMVHVNNFTSEINAWADLFEEVIALVGGNIDHGKLFDALYAKAQEGDASCGGLLGYNFISGEPIAQVDAGAPMIVRMTDEKLTLANFMKMQIYSALGSLAIGCEILLNENVQISSVCGHGGFFKAPLVGQSAMSAAVGAPVTVMQNAGEGGAWGIAVLALFTYLGEQNLESFLDGIFADTEKTTVSASNSEVNSFKLFMKKYKQGLAVERLAVENLKIE